MLDELLTTSFPGAVDGDRAKMYRRIRRPHGGVGTRSWPRVRATSHRIRDNSDLSRVTDERPLSEAARAARVIGDAVVELGSCERRRNDV